MKNTKRKINKMQWIFYWRHLSYNMTSSAVVGTTLKHVFSKCPHRVQKRLPLEDCSSCKEIYGNQRPTLWFKVSSSAPFFFFSFVTAQGWARLCHECSALYRWGQEFVQGAGDKFRLLFVKDIVGSLTSTNECQQTGLIVSRPSRDGTHIDHLMARPACKTPGWQF